MRITLLILLSLSIFACKPNLKDQEVKKLYDEVMVIHDEVMPEISTINKLKKKIRKLDIQTDTTRNMIRNLDDADEAMMSWMSDFQVFRKMDDDSREVKLKFLKEEKAKISAVSNQMKASITNANKFLDENN